MKPEPTLLIQGDAQRIPLADESVQCVITSPPYWMLRDYGLQPSLWDEGWMGNLGTEPTPDLYVRHLVEIFREVKRVLRPDGTLWCVIGDTYAANRSRQVPDTKHKDVGNRFGMRAEVVAGKRIPRGTGRWGGGNAPATAGVKLKSLVGIPWRLALALQSDGWIIRSDIIWEKPNVMPESVKDRPTRSHEHIFLLAKSSKYSYDWRAIQEPAKPVRPARKNTHADVDRDIRHGTRKQDAIAKGTYVGFNAWYRNRPVVARNKRDVWHIPTEPFSGAKLLASYLEDGSESRGVVEHFATFPRKLVETCLLAGSRPGDIVLDPFCGSGTVGEVCRKFGRRFVGVELHPAYLLLAQARVERADDDDE